MMRKHPSSFRHCHDTAQGRVVYVGPYLDEEIVRLRGLRGYNAAGSNRMARIGRALAAAGLRPIILSPAISLRAKAPDSLVHSPRVRRTGPVVVVYAACINVVGFNVLSSVLTQFLTLRTLIQREPLSGVIFYNSNTANVLMAAYLRLCTRLRILHNAEDIYTPKLRDWLPDSATRPLQNISFWLGQKLMGFLVHGYIVPTQRFLPWLSERPIARVVTGCIDFGGRTHQEPNVQLRVLYAGKIEREHGICHFVEALRILDESAAPPALEVDISGMGDQADFVEKSISSLRNIKACFHGFVSKSTYEKLLAKADVCLALQDPAGRNAQLKTPSKVYEFLGYGKAVIATDVGDLAQLDPEVLKIIRVLDAQALAKLLTDLANEFDAVAVLRVAAQNHAIKHYSYDAVGKVIAGMISEPDRVRP